MNSVAERLREKAAVWAGVSDSAPTVGFSAKAQKQLHKDFSDAADLIERLTKERDEAFAANERDRSIIADARASFNAALARRSWLLEGRGSYEWDDDRWKDEFGEAIKELRAPLDVLGKLGIDWSLCPTSPEEIAAARIDWKAQAETAERLLAEATGALNPFSAFADALNEEAPDTIAIGIFADGAMRFGPSGGANLGSLRLARTTLSNIRGQNGK